MTIEGAAYGVVIAPGFAGFGAELGSVAPKGRCVIVTNAVVGPLHGPALESELLGAGWEVSRLEVPDGEANKTLANWSVLVDAILDLGVDRRTPILALGGGVTGDLVGFAAASVLRGVPLVQLPTTLLAMVDASVGGKTGVNTAQGKNLVGAFHQPRLVWASLATLSTLPREELRGGLGEVVKHALIAGESALAACEASAPALRAGDPEALARVIAESVITKAGIVAADPLEQGNRAILNLGHTLGHALEAVLGYGVLRHGEAVALGSLAMTRFARTRGWLDDLALTERLERLLRALELPTHVPGTPSPLALEKAVGFDKKRLRGMIRIVVPIAPGRVELRSLPLVEVPELVASLSPNF